MATLNGLDSSSDSRIIAPVTMLFFSKKRKIADTLQFKVPLSRARKMAQILVIDNDPNAFPATLLREEGFNVHYWDRVNNIRDLETGKFDVIVLDIKDVAAKEISASDGLGILTHLKKVNPAQLIIAYSGETYDLTHQQFWQLANDCLGKPSDLLTCKEKLDALLEEKFNVAYYWTILGDTLFQQGVDSKTRARIEDSIARALSNDSPLNQSSILGGLRLSKEALGIASTLVSIILKFNPHV